MANYILSCCSTADLSEQHILKAAVLDRQNAGGGMVRLGDGSVRRKAVGSEVRGAPVDDDAVF